MPFDTFSATIDWGDGSGPQPVIGAGLVPPTLDAMGTISAPTTYTIPGEYEVVVKVTDGLGNWDDDGVIITVVSPGGDPIITEMTGPQTPQPLPDGVQISASFTDESGTADTYTAMIDWGDGSDPTTATVTPPSGDTPGTISANRVYDAVGVYTVTLTLTDGAGTPATQEFEFVVVFDPAAARTLCRAPASTGRAPRLGRAAPSGVRRRSSATTPATRAVPTDRRARHSCGFSVTSSSVRPSYDYLIVNDAIAIAEGVGSIGSNEYRFRVQGIDNGWLDFFQITIWDPVTDEVVYDNGILYDKGDVVLLGGIKVKS